VRFKRGTDLRDYIKKEVTVQGTRKHLFESESTTTTTTSTRNATTTTTTTHKTKVKIMQRYKTSRLVSINVPLTELEKLRRDPQVLYVDQDVVFELDDPLVMDEIFFGREKRNHTRNLRPLAGEANRKLFEMVPYGIEMVNADKLEAKPGASVCIIDSGYWLGHEDLPSANVTGRSFFDVDFTHDDTGHGTHVAGTIAAIKGNGIGVQGIIAASHMKLHVVK